jgi:outer membrane lipoprotein SlyB
METANTVGSANAGQRHPGILYPVMLIAAIALIVFSVVGIATMMGWMPAALSGSEPAEKAAAVPAAKPAASRPRAMANAPAACSDCGVIESIRAVEVEGEGTGIGAVGGAVVGGILGNQVGRGGGRTAATMVGVGAGAVAGHEIEKSMKKSMSYEVRVRMNDGTYRTFHEPAQPELAIGQKVRVTERGIAAAS